MALSPRAKRRLRRVALGGLVLGVLLALALAVAGVILRVKASTVEADLLGRLTAQRAAVQSRARPVLWGEALDADAAERYGKLDVAFSTSESDVSFKLDFPRHAVSKPDEIDACQRVADAHVKDVAALHEAASCRWCRWDLSRGPGARPPLHDAVDLLFVHARARADADPEAAMESLLGAVRIGSDLERGDWNGGWIVDRGLSELLVTLVRSGDRLPLDRVERALDGIEGDLEPVLETLERWRVQQGLALARRMRSTQSEGADFWLADPHEHLCSSTEFEAAFVLPEWLLIPHAVVSVDAAYARAERATRSGDLAPWATEERLLRGYACQCLDEPHAPPAWNPWVVSHFPRAALFVDCDNLVRARIALARAAIRVTRAHGSLGAEALPVDPCDPSRRIVLERTGSRWALVSVGPRGYTHHAPRGPVRLEGP